MPSKNCLLDQIKLFLDDVVGDEAHELKLLSIQKIATSLHA